MSFPLRQMTVDEWLGRFISTQRLRIRAFRQEDAGDLYEYLSNDTIYVYESGEPQDQLQAQAIAVEFSSGTNFWAVELIAEHKVIGQIYFQQIEPLHRMTWELGYIFNPHYHHHGYATEAVSALIRCGFAFGGIHRITAHCNPENTASWRLLERVGFRREGLLKKETFFRRNANGEPLWTDTFVYALLGEEINA
jgi:[ribosomal protein S5]-alanine N-acetyltransferase